MAPNHVPSELHQGQTIYTDPSYENLFPSDQYGAQAWNANQLHSGLVPNNAANQSWHPNSFPQQPYAPISSPYATQGHAYQTASPYQYGQFNNHGSMGNYARATNVDPSLGVDPTAMRQQQQSPYQVPPRNGTPQAQAITVTPQALQQGPPRPTPSTYQIPKTTAEQFAQRAVPATFTKPVKNPEYEVPKGRKSGGFVVLDQAALAKATKSSALNKLVTFGSEPLHLASNRTALPLYTPRQSVKDLRKSGADNKKLLAKKPSTKSSHRAGAVKSPRSGVSDSSSYDESSDDDSEYTDDEDDEPSPLPTTRPDEPHAAYRYDVIKATWYPRKSQPNSEKIKASLRDLWEILNTIQKRWRADSKAVSEAEEQKKVGELPVLKSRVTSQRDFLQSALKSALEYAHPDVLYHIGQVKPFLYLCYQFLANRFKMQDYDGSLPSVIYEMLVRSVGTLTTELLEETKVIKALNSMKKNANAKNKALIQQIVEGAAAGSKKTKVSSPPVVEVVPESKPAKRPAAQPASRPSGEGGAGKRPKVNEPTTNGEKKLPAPASKSSPATSTTQKRPGEKPVPAPVKVRGNQVVNKPSTLFASLNAASKKPAATAAPAKSNTKTSGPTAKDKKPAPAAPAKPAFSFAATMAQLLKPKEDEVAKPKKPEKQLPPETPEEKEKRERKEARRQLRVKWKPDVSLVSVRYFHHDPEEESGHDENFVRDAGDIGGEGRMFKQHKDMADDEDDEDLIVEVRPWLASSLIDFSTVDPAERQRNYHPYGGGELQPSCPERDANIKHESCTLVVDYYDQSDIPSSPREPLQQQTQPSASATVTNFGAPQEWVLSRAPMAPTSAPTTAGAPDFSNLENIFKQFAAPTTNNVVPQATASQGSFVAPPAAPAPVPDLASILSALNPQAQAQAPTQTPAQFPAAQQPSAVPPLDFNAIMSAIQASASNPALPQPPMPPGWPAYPTAFPQAQHDGGGSAYQTEPQAAHTQHVNGNGKRQREDGQHNERGGSFKKHKGGRPHKVIACRFFQKGTCNKGDDCTYIHDLNA